MGDKTQGIYMKFRVDGRLRLKRPGCACAMTRLGLLNPCFWHFSSRGGILKSRDYLLRAWREYDREGR